MSIPINYKENIRKHFFQKLNRVYIQVSTFTAIMYIRRKTIDKDTFTGINSKEDQSKDSYKSSKTLLKSTKMPLELCTYIRLKNKRCSLVYIIDGLDSFRSYSRNAGDL